MNDDAETNRKSRGSLVGFAAALMIGAGVLIVLTSTSNLLEGGTPAPAFSLPRADSNEEVSLESLRGKVVLLDFWSTSCGPCIRLMAELEVIHRQIDADDLVILGINTEGAPPQLIREFAQAQGVQYTMLLDDERVSAAYQVQTLPTIYLIDREGNIRWSRVGFISHEQLSEVIRGLI